MENGCAAVASKGTCGSHFNINFLRTEDGEREPICGDHYCTMVINNMPLLTRNSMFVWPQTNINKRLGHMCTKCGSINEACCDTSAQRKAMVSVLSEVSEKQRTVIKELRDEIKELKRILNARRKPKMPGQVIPKRTG